jgi:hypothetical protein
MGTGASAQEDCSQVTSSCRSSIPQATEDSPDFAGDSYAPSYPLTPESDKRPGQVTRLRRRLHARGLVAKIPHARRWRVSLDGRRTMATAIKLREVAYPSLFAAAA